MSKRMKGEQGVAPADQTRPWTWQIRHARTLSKTSKAKLREAKMIVLIAKIAQKAMPQNTTPSPVQEVCRWCHESIDTDFATHNKSCPNQGKEEKSNMPKRGLMAKMGEKAEMNFLKNCKWDATPGWCSLCREPISSWQAHRGNQTATGYSHNVLELLFQNFLREGNRRSFPQAVYRDAGLLSAPFVSLYSLASFTEQNRRFRLSQILSELKLPVFHKNGTWDDRICNWTSPNEKARRRGKMSLCPVIVRCIMGMFPKVSSGLLSAALGEIDRSDNYEEVFHYLTFEKLFPAGVDLPICIHGRCSVVKTAGDNLKGMLTHHPSAPTLSRAATAHQRVLASYALRSLGAEVVINKMEELAARLEGTWKEIGRPVDVMPTSEALTMTTKSLTKERWDELFFQVKW